VTVPASRTVLITGASGGIGGALAVAYAAPGVDLVLHGRKESALDAVAARCRALGAVVRTRSLDLRDVAALRAWLAGEPAPDLAIVNAGVNGLGGDGGWPSVEEVLEVNVRAAIATAEALLPAMRARGSGQVALLSSLAAWYGLPAAPAYSASKAALKAYGEAMRGRFASEGIGFTVVMPGFVETPMERVFPGAKPFLWQPERAARYIRERLARNPARISFPFPLTLGSWLLAALPPAWSQRLAALLGYGR